ncbi:MAG: hydroxyethylthiazole kinase [Acidilobaceae archaeon]
MRVDVGESVRLIRERRPLVHHIMNYVVMTDAANATLAIGASPIMAHAVEELEDLASVAGAIYINIGTLDTRWVESMITLAKLAGKYDKPLLLDPVGAGATRLRTQVSFKILETGAVRVVKGNAGEMLSLAGLRGTVKGVDSEVAEAHEPLAKFSAEYDVVAVSTGKTDYVAYKDSLASISGGSELFRFTTGSGCMMGSVVASFMAVQERFRASIEASAAFKFAGEIAEARAGRNPASFRAELLNALYNLPRYDLRVLEERIRFL